MVVVHKKAKFDPAAHLHKHGWKGKGTALKHGHAIRPLAVVQKKTLSGIGKDRDEAVPFWDHIFAATAASLFSPSPSSSPGPSSSSWAPAPIKADQKGNIISNPQEIVAKRPKLSINATARAGRELAKRGLYSRFFRGKVLHIKESDDDGEEEVPGGMNTPKEVEEVEDSLITAGPSRLNMTKLDQEREEILKVKKNSKGKSKDRETESTEERKIRQAEKARRKAEKGKGKGKMVEGEGKEEDVNEDVKAKSEKKKNKKTDGSRKDDIGEVQIAENDQDDLSGKKDKKRKRKDKEDIKEPKEMKQSKSKSKSKCKDMDQIGDSQKKEKKKKSKSIEEP
ncbi:hypothetical protein I203_101863 [Kwoniella mangroviensis CBS 8507]|uniref:uncharacterized protein n=1 Tax=Kwoniella mangroviensis CBS 8507 TaxID=1296122 RepID=UPI00080CC899|nr:uncharacterized protein I203_03059 [Kwoniella mangroviensis CBS 8507]OCF67365.1 hypothetical protein I203_03059 [Kwoniella mangroviensis CBS 8507]